MTPDGTAIRDYIHVEDLAEAHARALDWASAHGAPTSSISGRRRLLVREVIALVEEVRRPVVPCAGPTGAR